MRTRGSVGPVMLLVVLALSGCTSGNSAPPPGSAGAPTADASEDTVGAHTPGDLRDPCRLVPATTVAAQVGEPVRAAGGPKQAGTRECRYPARARGSGPVPVEIRSGYDPTPLDSLVGLYLGVDRWPHHPVRVHGADDAEVVREPGTDHLTLFVKQGFATHVVVVRLPGAERAERVAIRLAGLVVQGDR